MLKIKLFTSSRQLKDLSFSIKDIPNNQIKIVVPSPTIADDARILFQSNEDQVEILTISKFRKDNIYLYDQKIEEVRKADLLILLSTVWKRFFADDDSSDDCRFEAFIRTFNLFTDLRSFSLNLDLISTVLEEYDPTLQKGVITFWNICQQMGVVDEHRAYSLLSEGLRASNGPLTQIENSVFIFYGFSIMSAGQVDLLKALAIRNDVVVPFPQDAYDNKRDFDWITWLEPDVVDQSQKITDAEKNRLLDVVEFSKNNLSNTLKSFFCDRNIEGFVDVYLGSRKSDFGPLLEIPFNGLYFKAPADIFASKCDALFDNFDLSLKNSDQTSDILINLDQQVSDQIKKKDFRGLKVSSLLHKIINKWRNLSDDNEIISSYDLRVLKYVHQLMLPRNFSIPLFSKIQQIEGSIATLDGLGRINDNNTNIICITSDYSQMSLTDSKFSDNVLTLLAPIGPIPRREMDFYLLKSKIIDVVSSPNAFLFIEQGILGESLVWNEVFKDYEINTKMFAIKKDDGVVRDVLQSESEQKIPLSSLSATKIQSYIDCPRQYYYKYINPISPFVELSNDLLPNQLGVVQHKVIERYFSSSTNEVEYSHDIHQKVVRDSLDRYLREKDINLSERDYRKHFIEISDYSRNGIEKLSTLLKLDPSLNFEFERSIADKTMGVVGSVDCLIKGKFGYGLIDFKRSSSSIPSKIDLFEYKKIQLWFYIKYLKIDPKNLYFFGFLNLSSPSESIFFAADDIAHDDLTEKIEFIDRKRFYVDKLAIDERLNEYQKVEDDIVLKISNDTTYSPIPIDNSICNYCSVKNVCPKIVVNGKG